jgi:hypothetical protein
MIFDAGDFPWRVHELVENGVALALTARAARRSTGFWSTPPSSTGAELRDGFVFDEYAFGGDRARAMKTEPSGARDLTGSSYRRPLFGNAGGARPATPV